MAKLLIEIEAFEEEMPIDLVVSALASYLQNIAEGNDVVRSYTATVTNDQGEVIRESE